MHHPVDGMFVVWEATFGILGHCPKAFRAIARLRGHGTQPIGAVAFRNWFAATALTVLGLPLFLGAVRILKALFEIRPDGLLFFFALLFMVPALVLLLIPLSAALTATGAVVTGLLTAAPEAPRRAAWTAAALVPAAALAVLA